MVGMNLEFQGTGASGLLWALLVGVSAVLCVWGAMRLIRGRVRSGVISFAAAAGPAVFLPALLIDGGLLWARRDWRAGRTSILAGAVFGIVACLLAAWAAAAGMDGATWVALLGLHIATAVAVIYSGVYTHLGVRRLSALTALRFLAILVLLGLLFKPVLVFPLDADAHKPLLPIVVDRSASMATADQPALPNRHAQAIQMLQSQRQRLGKYFRPRWLAFGTEATAAKSLGDLQKLSPTGTAADGTDIAAGLREARQLAGENRPAGIVLISDGINNAADSPITQSARGGTAVYAVGVGSQTATAGGIANRELLSVDVPFEAAVGNVTELTVKVRVTRFANADGEVRLYAGDGKTPVATEKIWTPANDATVTAKLKWTPQLTANSSDKPVRRLRVVVKPNALEVNKDDNSAEVHVLITDPKIRVLYVEGTMRPEYKFLRRLLDTDPNVQFLGMVRVAKNRFWSQGSIDGRKLAALPARDEDFKMFDVIILGDLDRSFLSRDQLSRLRKFVSDGGGLLMLGGRNSFGPGGYAGTEVAAILPVAVKGRSDRQVASEFSPRLTALGQSHPIFRGITGYFPGPGGRQPDAKLAKLPPLRGCVMVGRAKPAAAILAIHPTIRVETGPLVVLAVQPFGAGRCGAFTADTTWQWYLPTRAMGQDSPYGRFWGQMIRWLAGAEAKTREAGAAAVLRVSDSYFYLGSGELKLLGRIQDADGQPAVKARVRCEIFSDNAGKSSNAVAKISLSSTAGRGLYRGQWRPAAAGRYTVKLTAVDPGGKTLGTDSLTITVIRQNTEKQKLARDDNLLRRIAKVSGGQFADLAALPDLLDNIIDRRKTRAGPPPQAKSRRLYNFPILFILFVALLTSEWLLRRSWNMQ